jgi:hypothetical protein
MKHVDYGTVDLDLIEYNEDQMRLDHAEGRERLAGTEGNSAT